LKTAVFPAQIELSGMLIVTAGVRTGSTVICTELLVTNAGTAHE